MGFPKYISLAFLVIIILFTQSINAQIVFKELPEYNINKSDSTFFNIGPTRNIIPLNGIWNVYQSSDKKKNKVSVPVPSLFNGNGELVFEKEFSLTKDEILNHKMKLDFLGLNYSADISVNGVIIHRHSGGTFPFKFDLPRDILHYDKSNILTVKLFYKLDSEDTIPLKQRFLFPKNFGGIFRDIYIQLLPNISVNDLNLTYTYDVRTKRAKINVLTKIDDHESNQSTDSLSSNNKYKLSVKFISPKNGKTISMRDYPFQILPYKEKDINQTTELISPDLWSPSNPQYYNIKIEILNKDNLVDEIVRPLSIYSLKADKKSLTLNGNNFTLNGVTYIPSFKNYGEFATYSEMKNDIRMIKELGFNSVRFSKEVPHPYYLQLCEQYGLLAFIELPLSNVPEQLAQDPNFITRCKNYLIAFIKAYKKYSSVAAIGFGGSYYAESDAETSLLKSLASIVNKETDKLTYASFSGFDVVPVDGLDLYGVELFNTSISKVNSQFKNLQKKIGAGKVFISSATYTVNTGNSNGYLNAHSFEAQAKYFEDIIDYSSKNKTAGYFLNSMFDYRGDYASLVAGYNKDNLYRIGISGEDRGTDRIGYKVIYSKLHNAEKVTIPIGSKKDDAPMIFVIAGLLLALIMGVLVNSGRKFREDSSRALLRPYNFFADVRDQRIMSGYHSTVLAVIVSAVIALTISNLLFYYRENIVVEKILLAFGSTGIIKTVSYLAWHPFASLLWLTILSFVIIIAITIIVKAASFFVRNKVFFSSAYFAVIWSFLPLVLLIPVGIILYRVLIADAVNFYIYLCLILFAVWAFYRLMKGIYVIYDINAASVYFYSIIIVLVLISGFLIYFQMKNSVFDYLQLTFNQYHILG
jgi:beta-galactosidase